MLKYYVDHVDADEKEEITLMNTLTNEELSLCKTVRGGEYINNITIIIERAAKKKKS